MAQHAKKRKSTKSNGLTRPAIQRRDRRKYTAGEIFAALLGAALVVLFVGLVITSILE